MSAMGGGSRVFTPLIAWLRCQGYPTAPKENDLGLLLTP